ncbi:MAG: acetyl/propionyl/methylcrotonyl-CoA carboxylase subunit alpha [Proteobacteria bacterium]|nr:acetyl/propionyl/methylcrotonyl-CoA carboxylase subunit alpha [Pseudomonadota bacterium]
MFDKILIANRGEIACRVIRGARSLGIATVAVYSEADAAALHVELADEAVPIGPAPAAESYLAIERIVAACKATGAQGLHPGFGFLAENPDFVEALEAEDIVFIGPPAGAIRAMGDKIESKRLALDAGVDTVPGHMGVIADEDEAARIAAQVGYPVMLKASAGGGGKGMRIARDEASAREGFRSARNEARASFGDERIFIEKYIEEPRHIEIQVLADAHGNIVHLGERECSIQRRHQKVIEEAPSPLLDPETRAAMGDQAIALAKAVDYRSAGTVEFIVDKNKNFYFLEMNTRIQVEHPVTEMVTGLDLVAWMIRIAAGEKLDFAQDDVTLTGWALECRVYAEDPSRDFMPSIGRLVRYREPPAGPRLRVDSGVTEGSEITVFYDPMVAKVVTHGETRDAAIREMRAALDAFYVRGIDHNMNFLAAVIATDRFRDGRLSTDFIAEEFPGGFQEAVAPAPVRAAMIAVAAFVQRRLAARKPVADGLDEPAPRAGPVASDDRPDDWPDNWMVRIDGVAQAVKLDPVDGGYRVTGAVADCVVESDWRPGEPLFFGRIDGRPVTVQIDRRGPFLRLSHGGAEVEALVLRPRVAELAARMPAKQAPDLSRYLLSPMPGLLVKVVVAAGQEVKAGEVLAVVEAMKMENVLRAERDGVVARLHAEPGASLAVDQAILEFV